MMRSSRLFIVITAIFLNVSGAKAEEIVISGSGIALATVERLGESLTANHPGIVINLLPSMGSVGGIRALRDSVIDLSISARSLTPDEIHDGMFEAYCFITPLVLATKSSKPRNIHLADLPEFYRNPAPTWPDGDPLTVVLRTESGSEQPYLSERVPGLAEAFATAQARHGAVIGLTDQLNLDIGETMPNALVITTVMQIISEKRRLTPVLIDGVEASPETLADDSYPFSMRVCIIARHGRISPGSAAFLEHLKSPAATQVLTQFGAIPDN